jgi:hypothetical protein
MTAQRGSRQARMAEFVPTVGPPDILSADAKQYTAQVPSLQRAAAASPVYNGQAAVEAGHRGVAR